MNRLLWFCPENDIALGHGCTRFTPPRQAALLACYGAPLMWWMGEPGDYVLMPPVNDAAYNDIFAQWTADVTRRFGAGPVFVSSLDGGIDVDAVFIWGWSSYAIDRLLRAGVRRSVIGMQDKRVDAMRMLSHRRSAGFINDALARIVDFEKYANPVPEAAFEAFCLDDVMCFARRYPEFYVKSPWSSSGRGVVRSDAMSSLMLLERCSGIIRSQGSVLLEPAYDKVADFAMLFEVSDVGDVVFYGYSGFFNSRDAAYGGNLVIPDSEIFAMMAGFVGADIIDEVRNALVCVIAGMVKGAYSGLLGVDMMVARGTDEQYVLVPCVELNLRMTMGHVAHSIFLKTGMRGKMTIAPSGRCTERAVVNLVPVNDYFNILLS